MYKIFFLLCAFQMNLVHILPFLVTDVRSISIHFSIWAVIVKMKAFIFYRQAKWFCKHMCQLRLEEKNNTWLYNIYKILVYRWKITWKWICPINWLLFITSSHVSQSCLLLVCLPWYIGINSAILRHMCKKYQPEEKTLYQ